MQDHLVRRRLSVGAGNVLGGVIASGVVPTIRLRDIFRQAAESMIVSNAHRIVTGQLPGNHLG